MNFQGERSDYQALSDKVYAAMETGNHDQARLVLKEHQETFPVEVATIRHLVLREYGIRLS